MAPQSQTSDSYRFGPFLVDAPAGQLRKGSTKLRLAGQPFDILLMLLERSGQVVTREEIQQRLWPQETFVDFENSLNKAINKLRQALSDSAEKPVYIETLPRRGYRFIGTLLPPVAGDLPKEEPLVTPASESASGPFPQAPTTRGADESRPRSVLRVAALSLLIPLAFLTWLAFRPVPPPHVLGVGPMTTSSRVDLYGGLHTDGVRLYFLVRRGHKWELSQMPV
ncbi:MAG TPA: winged helix-turn-helix domain-containing protein, partial [Candidatus Acidoferrum sp.]|nr:winged helix-turn-helix domain-containing protein [Candidatus Acidoferrum sp.]